MKCGPLCGFIMDAVRLPAVMRVAHAVPSALGAGIGLVGALSLSGVIRSLIHEVSATDSLLNVSIAVGFGILTLLATWLPARRAARVDPASLLRV